MTFLVLMRLRYLRKFDRPQGCFHMKFSTCAGAESHQLLSRDLLKLLSELFQGGQDEWNCCAAAFTQSQHSLISRLQTSASSRHS